jgi:hypothetical protein
MARFRYTLTSPALVGLICSTNGIIEIALDTHSLYVPSNSMPLLLSIHGPSGDTLLIIVPVANDMVITDCAGPE